MQHAEFTIALPVYNGGELLKLCIQSILTQSYPHFKLLIFNSCNNNDGSTEYIQSINDHRVKIIQASTPLNIEQNWARFFDFFESGYGTIIGQDDMYEPSFLKCINDLINTHPDASLWQTHFNLIDGNGIVIRQCAEFPSIETGEVYLRNILEAKVDSVGTGYVFKISDYKQCGGIPLYPSLLFADLSLWLQLTNLSYKANSIDIHYSFRIHTSTTSSSSAETYLEAFDQFIDFLYQIAATNKNQEKVVQETIANYFKFVAEIIAFKIVRQKAAPTFNHKILTVKYLIKHMNKTYERFLIPSKIKISYTLKTKLAGVINSIPILKKMYQRQKGIR